MEFNNVDVHVSRRWFADQNRLFFAERVLKTADGLEMPEVKIPECLRLNDLEAVYDWLFSV